MPLGLTQPAELVWSHASLVYQIWVRSFYDANGDGHGDLEGVRQKLPYLKDLGVKALWLSPIFESPSYHGYDTANYYAVNADYGTMADFEKLVADAKKHDIRIMLDLVINHVSDQHPWFLKALKKDPDYQDYFVWSDKLPANYGLAWFDVPDPTSVWHHKESRKGDWYYGAFGYQQPDLNLKNPKVVAEVKKVAEFWLDKGVDGFRLDAIRYFIEEGGIPHQADTQSTLDFLVDFNAFVKRKKPGAFLIGEALADNDIIAKYYSQGKGIDAVFDFHFARNLDETFSFDPALPLPSDEDIAQRIDMVKQAFWRNLNQRNASGVPGHFFAPFMNNHDTNRAIADISGDWLRAKLMAALTLTSPGTAFIYYGEEIGLPQAGTLDDMYRRALMQWDASNNAGFNTSGKRWLDDSSWFPWNKNFKPWWGDYWKTLANKAELNVQGQQAKPDSLLNFYRQLIAVRQANPALAAPDELGFYENTGNAWVLRYRKGEQILWVMINLDAGSPTAFPAVQSLQGKRVNLLNNQPITVTAEMVLDAGEVLVLKAEQ